MTTGPDLDRHAFRFLGRPRHETFLHIRSLHFADNSQRPDQSEEYDRMWKLRTIFDTLDDNFAKFYKLSENLAVDVVIIRYMGRVIFRQYIPRKENVSASKFRNCVTKHDTCVP